MPVNNHGPSGWLGETRNLLAEGSTWYRMKTGGSLPAGARMGGESKGNVTYGSDNQDGKDESLMAKRLSRAIAVDRVVIFHNEWRAWTTKPSELGR